LLLLRCKGSIQQSEKQKSRNTHSMRADDGRLSQKETPGKRPRAGLWMQLGGPLTELTFSSFLRCSPSCSWAAGSDGHLSQHQPAAAGSSNKQQPRQAGSQGRAGKQASSKQPAGKHGPNESNARAMRCSAASSSHALHGRRLLSVRWWCSTQQPTFDTSTGATWSVRTARAVLWVCACVCGVVCVCVCVCVYVCHRPSTGSPLGRYLARKPASQQASSKHGGACTSLTEWHQPLFRGRTKQSRRDGARVPAPFHHSRNRDSGDSRIYSVQQRKRSAADDGCRASGI
jgi:hypothetical protein